MTRSLLLKNGTVFDPINGVFGESMDLCISDGRIVEKVGENARTLDLKGRVVMPGGIDIHTHIMGCKLDVGRSMCPEDHRIDPSPGTSKARAGVGSTMPSSYVIGHRYSAMGYTTAIEPAVAALKALSCWEELVDIPSLNLGMLPMLGNSMVAFHYIKEHDMDGLAAYIAWVLAATGGLGVKIVNPGGVYAWARGQNVREIDTAIPDWGITPRDILISFAETVERLGIAHPLHLHPNNLGRVGNIETTIATLEALRKVRGHGGRKRIVHLTHVSFESLGMREGGVPEWKDVESGGLALSEYARRHDHFTSDMGQIVFGRATTMTGDGPFQFSLYQMTHGKWANIGIDVEMSGGAGVVPYTYKTSSLANSVQWTIALEYALSLDDPWRCVLTTDHPNAGPFTMYPLIISWLMSKKARDEWMTQIHPSARDRSSLNEIDREWGLSEIAVSTRAAPARILGIDKFTGHLGISADADIAVYDFNPQKADINSSPRGIVKTFSTSYLTVLHGAIVSKKGVVDGTHHGNVLTAKPSFSPETWQQTTDRLEPLFDRWYAHSIHNYPVPERYRHEYERPMAVDMGHLVD